MNTCVMVGNATRDPELTYGQSGLARARLSIALDLPPARDGQPEKDPEYRNITVFGVQAENVAESVVKGTRVLVVARSETYKVEAEIDGEAKSLTITGYVAQHIGPELRFATAAVTRNPKKGHSQGNDRPARRPEPEPEDEPAPRRQAPARRPEPEPEPERRAPARRAPARRQEPDDSDDF